MYKVDAFLPIQLLCGAEAAACKYICWLLKYKARAKPGVSRLVATQTPVIAGLYNII